MLEKKLFRVNSAEIEELDDLLGVFWSDGFRPDPRDSSKIIPLKTAALLEFSEADKRLANFTGSLTGDEYNLLWKQRRFCLLEAFPEYHSKSYQHEDDDDYELDLADLGMYLAMELADKQLEKLLPQKKTKPKKISKKHKARAIYILDAKEKMKILHWQLLRSEKSDFPRTMSSNLSYVNISELKVQSASDFLYLLNLTDSRSDATIHSAFMKGFQNRDHRMRRVFAGVNDEAEFSGLTSLKALQRSLSQYRKKIDIIL